MVQSLNYYTGIVFRGFTHSVGYPVLSGGRYDNLVQRFGKDCPATGFSLGINMIMTALERQGKLQVPIQGGYYIVYHKDARKKAFSLLSELKAGGAIAELDIASMDIDSAKSYAKSRGIDKIVVIDKDSNIEII